MAQNLGLTSDSHLASFSCLLPLSQPSLTTIDSSLISGTAERIAAIRVSDEGQEGLSAFLDKRRPSWIKE